MLFSVIVPLFNKREYVRRSISSILSQKLKDFEIIVVDDGSTDGSADAVHAAGALVEIIRQENTGPGPARNRAVTAAKGEWLAFMDADDVWAPNHLQALSDAIDRFPTANAVSTTSRQIRSADLPSMDADVGPGECRAIDFLADAGEAFVQTSSIAIRRSTFIAEGGFGNFCPGEDTEFWTRLALNNDFVINTAKTSGYRRETWGIMERIEKLAQPPSGPGVAPAQIMLCNRLEDRQYIHRRDAITAYLDRVHVRDARICLVRGYPAIARAHLKAVTRRAGFAYLSYRTMAWVPGPLFRPCFRILSRARYHLLQAWRRSPRA